MQIIYIMYIFSASRKRTGRHVTMYCNNTYNRRPFFCVLSAFNSLNDKIYIKANKTREKYLIIAYLAIARLLLHIHRRYPPPDTQPTTHPTHPQNFLFFLFFSIGVYLVFPLSLCMLCVCVGRWRRSRRTDGNH